LPPSGKLPVVGGGSSANSNSAGFAIDANGSTAWSTTTGVAESSAYVWFDLGATQNLGSVLWQFNPSGFADSMEIHVYDGANWKKVATVGNAPALDWRTLNVSAPARYVLFNFTNPAAGQYLGYLAEVMFWGTAGATSTTASSDTTASDSVAAGTPEAPAGASAATPMASPVVGTSDAGVELAVTTPPPGTPEAISVTPAGTPKVSGPTVTVAASSATASPTPPSTVTSTPTTAPPATATATATPTVTPAVLANAAPVAAAGADQVAEDIDGDGIEPVVLDGSASVDPEGTIASYQWLDEAGVVIATEESPQVALTVGSYTLTLLVADDAGATASDEITIEVRPAATIPAAAATLLDVSGAEIGSTTFVTGADGAVSVRVALQGLSEGAHGIHLHETGACDPASGGPFASAGGHINPAGVSHGGHAGDLGNITTDVNGWAEFERVLSGVTLAQLLDEDGATLVIHADSDDGVSEPEGNSGARIACGVLGEVSLDTVVTLNAAVETQRAAVQAAALATSEALTLEDGDGDGLANGDEVSVYGTDPLIPDTDGDGVTDGDEVLVYATDPLNLTSHP